MQQTRVIKAGEKTRFLDKTVQTGIKQALIALAAQADGQILVAAGQRDRQILFNRNRAFKKMIPGTVDNAKSAPPITSLISNSLNR